MFSRSALPLSVALLAWVGLRAEPAAPPVLQTVRIVLVDALKPAESLRDITKSLPLLGNQRIGAAVHWPANMLLNGDPLFERYQAGQLTVRLPVRTIDLAPGQYTIDPGRHTFTIGQDGAVATNDPEMVVAGAELRLRCFPAVIQVIDGEEQGTFSARRLPGAFTVTYSRKVKVPQPKPDEPPETTVEVQLVPEAGTFDPLTLYLPGNTVEGGYFLKPYGVGFHLADGKVRLLSPEGRGLAAEADGLEIGIPTRLIDIHLRTAVGRTILAQMTGLKTEGPLSLTGAAQAGRRPRASKHFRGAITARTEPVELFAGGKESSLQTFVDCSFAAYRHAAMLVENSLVSSDAASLLMVEYNDRAAVPGQWNEMRLSVVDAAVPPVVKPQVAAFCRPAGSEDQEWQKADCELAGEFAERPLRKEPDPKTSPKETGSEGPKLVNPRAATLRFRMPALPMGAYDLLTAMDLGMPQPSARLAVSRLVVLVPPDIAGSLGFFTQKARDAFNLGEDIRIGLAARSDQPLPAGGPEVTLSDPNGGAWKHVLRAPERPGNTATFFLRLSRQTTADMAPGTYVLAARWGNLAPAETRIDLVDPHPATHFLSVMPGKYSALGANYHQALVSDFEEPDGARDLVQYAHRIGHNQLDLMQYNTDRTRRFPSIQEQVYPKYPKTPPAESYYRATPRDRLLNEGVRLGVGVNDTLITFNDNHAPRYIEPLLRCLERWIAVETQSMKHSPAARGLTFYDELYGTGLTVPPGQQEAFQKLAKLAYEDRFGVSPAQVAKDIARFTERPKARRDLKALDAYLSWYRFLDEGWADMNRRLQVASKRVLPSLLNTTRHRIWGTPGYSFDGEHGYIPRVLGPLDIGGFVTYSDNAGGWPLTHAMMADAYGFDPAKPRYLTIPFAISSDSGEYLQQNFLSGLSQKIHGAAFYAQPGLDPNGPWNRAAEANRDLFWGIVRRYGDLFLDLEPGYRQVGIYFSWRAQALSPHKGLASVAHKTEGLWISCIRAGFPADLLYDDDIVAGRGAHYRVILVPGIEFEQELSEEILDKLRPLIAAGKAVVVEKGSKLSLEGAVMMEDTEWDEFYQPLYQAAGWDHELERTFELTDGLTDKLREFLSGYVRPAAKHSMTVGPDWLRNGETWYLVVPNFEDPMFSYLHRQRLVAPAVRKLTVYDKPAVCYDVLEMQPVELTKSGDGLEFDADMRYSGGKVYAFMNRPIGAILLEDTPSPSPGKDLAVRVQVADAEGAVIRGAFPIELRLTDPKGRETVRWRSAAPVLQEVFRIPANAAPGQWTLLARELVAGHQAARKFDLRGSEAAARFAEDTRDVVVHDPALLKHLLAELKEAIVPVSDSDAPVAKLVQEVQPAFRDRGIELKPVRPEEVEVPNEVYRQEGVYNEYSHWDGRLVGPTFHTEAPVILLDIQGTHRWTAHLLRHGLLLDVPSRHNPGAGRALIISVPKAFHTAKDTIVISSGDVAGLERGLRALLSPDLIDGVTYPLLPPTERPKGDEKAFASLTQLPGKEVRATSTRRLARLENIVTAIAVHPESRRIVAGTRGYGDNLFCLDMQGRKLWSRYLSEYEVHRVEVTPDGRYVFASCVFDDRTYMLDAADGTIRWSVVNVPKKQVAHNFEGYASSYSHPTVYPEAEELVIHHKDGAAILGFDGRISAHLAVPPRVNGPVFSPDVTYFATVELVDHKETHQPPPVQGKLPPVQEIAVAYDHLRVYQVADGKRTADVPLGKVGIEHYEVTWPLVAGPVARRLGTEEHFDPAGTRLGTTETAPVPPAPFTMDENGVVHALEQTGRERWACSVADSEADTGAPGECALAPLRSGGVVAGTSRGHVVLIGSDGKVAWRTRLGEVNEPPGDYPRFVAEGRRQNKDISARVWPTIVDQDGDLDAIVKMGINRLANPSFESEAGGWSVEGQPALTRVAEAKDGTQSLRVGQSMVTQEIAEHVCRMATYVLEFAYRPVTPSAALVAGTLIDGAERVPSSLRLEGNTEEWHFGRLVTKTYDGTSRLSVGFYADGGEVLLDHVRLRQVRWPSANHMQNLALHRLQPLWVESFRIAYRGAPERVKDQLGNKVYVPILPELGGRAVFMDGALLHNGRLNDTKSKWYMMESPTHVELIWQKPAWVSHLALYFHQHHPDQAMSSFYVSYIHNETKQWKRFAHVEGNRKLFFVLKFDPIFTDRMRIEEDNIHPQHRTLTEIEAYGPLGGQETAAGVSKDPDAFAMYMAGPDHVDRRTVPDLVGPFTFTASVIPVPSTDDLISASTGTAPAVVDGRYYLGSNHGHVIANELGKPPKDAAISRPTRWGLLTPPTVYGGRIVLGDAGGQLHCLRADNAELLYQTRTGGRIYAAPLPDGDDLFVASLDGSLYKLDIANGSVLWTLELGGELRASPALAEGTVVAVSTKGKVAAVDAALGTVRWTTDLAPESVGSPAIGAGRVYVGDSAGTVHCLDLKTGKPVWQSPTGTTIETCPTLRNGSLFIVNLDGEVLRLSESNGAVQWRLRVGAEDALEPVATDTQLLVAVPNGIRVLRQADGNPDERFAHGNQRGFLSVGPPDGQGVFTIVGFCVYKGSIYLTEYPQKGGPIYLNQYSWALQNTTLGVASPVPAPGSEGGRK
jgi:outer membrane protein assembly factor BamB